MTYHPHPTRRHEEYELRPRRVSNKTTRRPLVGWCVVAVTLLLVLGFLAMEFQINLGILEAATTDPVDHHQQQHNNKRGSALPGSILAVDNGLTFGRHQQSSASSQQQLFYNRNKVDDNNKNNTHNRNRNPLPIKKILYYTKFWQHADFMFGEGSHVFDDCPVSACWATSHNKQGNGSNSNTTTTLERLQEFDAVLFHPINTLQLPVEQRQQQLQSIRQWRAPHQRFVLVHMESPLLYEAALKIPPYQDKGFFNWTMTYHWNSDIVRPYGYFVPRLFPHTGDKNRPNFHYAQLPASWIAYDSQAFRDGLARRRRSEDFVARARRPYQVAWLVSNCHTTSKREDYVRELSKHINVTIFGRCSQQPDLQTCDDVDCYNRIRRDYKFILGFENAFCNDYVTEKFFGRLEDFVVVVRGQANYSRLAPPHSYVDANDFASPRLLAKHLRKLHENDEEYLSYFWWQKYYRIASPLPSLGHVVGKTSQDEAQSQARRLHFAQSMCRLCERLHLDGGRQQQEHSVYANISQWFAQEGQCQSP